MNSKLESTEEEGYVRKEKVTFDAAYGNERMIAYVFLPTNAKPPYQVVVFFPGSGAQYNPSSANIEQAGYGDYLDFVVRSGRVAVFPVYKGTFERGGGKESERLTTDQAREWKINRLKMYPGPLTIWNHVMISKETKLPTMVLVGVDGLGSLVGSIENRFKTLILIHAGLPKVHRPPELDEINFTSRVRIPVLMINGKHDHVFPVETSQNPMFNFLGTPEKDKVHRIFEGGHTAPRKDVIRLVLDWLDRYLGPVA